MARTTKPKYTYEYPRPAVTVDLVVVTREVTPRLLLIQRDRDPFAGMWALPGGFVNENEPLPMAAARELLEETGVSGLDLEMLHAFGDPGRDPRGWTVSIAFMARIAIDQIATQAGDDARAADWFPLTKLPTLAFDHAQIIQRAEFRLYDRLP